MELRIWLRANRLLITWAYRYVCISCCVSFPTWVTIQTWAPEVGLGGERRARQLMSRTGGVRGSGQGSIRQGYGMRVTGGVEQHWDRVRKRRQQAVFEGTASLWLQLPSRTHIVLAWNCFSGRFSDRRIPYEVLYGEAKAKRCKESMERWMS